MLPVKDLALHVVTFTVALMLLTIIGCGESEKPAPIPKTHPAYGFYQIAKRGPTSVNICESYGGKEIYPNDYEVLNILGQGVFTLREKSTGKKYLGVSFGEGEILVKNCTCCWDIDT